ncbi:AmmeMemoRadiSam system protein B [Desulfonema magnum]|uniref:AmmeMemoSam_B n=1 Tax=Desulfonema magnum TaxID=45655 RepID=A0A975BPL0_9BACT|nr:AmmeMemoRadiSam system protein B [Desulfonema magnum]QTA89356.1 AmmeMemoSam_B [Desulfonema magnum]
MNARRSVFAGTWYPGNAAECEKEINNFLKAGEVRLTSDRTLSGGIVPHAGWYFSGSIACNVIHCLAEEEPPDVIVVFGMHLGPGSPCYIMTEGAWETPFGEIQIEKSLADELTQKFTFKIETAQRFTQDNTIELQLPFIKYFFEDVRIIPIGVPPAASSLEIGRAVAEISTRLGLQMKVIGSTDLTHYGLNYGFTPKGTGSGAIDWVRNENDRRIIDKMLAMDPLGVINEALKSQNACCAGAAATAIATAKHLGADRAESIAYASSYDKHPGDSFVGYVGIVF